MDEREIKERMESESEREELYARSDFGQIRSGIIIALAPFTVASCKAAYSLQLDHWQYGLHSKDLEIDSYWFNFQWTKLLNH